MKISQGQKKYTCLGTHVSNIENRCKFSISKYTHFRFPTDKEISSLWMKAIDPKNQTNLNARGYVCSLHFLPTDLEMYKGHRRLKIGTIPSCNMRVNAVNNIPNLKNDQLNVEPRTSEHYENLLVECKNLKESLFQDRMKYEMELMNKDDTIGKLLNKNNTQMETIVALKKRITFLEQKENKLELENDNLRKKLLQTNDSLDMNVTILSAKNLNCVLLLQ